MPIYAYKCASCGHAKDVLQKISDAALTTCPACGAEAFSKQLTAAGFQLKGSGWYVTDFRGGGAGAASAPAVAGAAAPAAANAESTASGGGGDSGATASSAAASTPCGGSCACH
jgi:putative FmdB family regulatory protein